MLFGGVYKGKRVLVTGHTGFKGSWLSQWLLDLGAEVIGFSKDIPTRPSHFDLLSLASQVRHHVGDVGDFGSIMEVIGHHKPDIVFHLAAQPIVSLSVSDPVNTFKTNMLGTVHLLEALRQTSSTAAAVFITSDKCYENVEWEYGYRENDRLGGKDPYSASKACAEISFKSYCRTFFNGDKGPRLATARAGNVIGGGDWAADRILPDCVRAWCDQKSSARIRSPKATRPWQHVLEPLSGYLCLGQKLLSSAAASIHMESFNFGPGAETNATVEELLKTVDRYWPGRRWDVDAHVLQGKEAGLLKLNCDKALYHLQWTPTLSFAETIDLTASWYRDFYDKAAAPASLTAEHIRRYTAMAQERQKCWV